MRTFSWLNPKLEIRNTPGYGDGIFANEVVEEGERLAIFGGCVLSLDEESDLPEEFQDTGLQIAEEFVLTSKEKKEDADGFNHSCEPNAGFKGQIFLVAMRQITPNEQVTFDYAMALSGDKSYTLDCKCEKDSCRKEITQDDWKNPVLREKYRGYFQEYLEEKIKKDI